MSPCVHLKRTVRTATAETGEVKAYNRRQAAHPYLHLESRRHDSRLRVSTSSFKRSRSLGKDGRGLRLLHREQRAPPVRWCLEAYEKMLHRICGTALIWDALYVHY